MVTERDILSGEFIWDTEQTTEVQRRHRRVCTAVAIISVILWSYCEPKWCLFCQGRISLGPTTGKRTISKTKVYKTHTDLTPRVNWNSVVVLTSFTIHRVRIPLPTFLNDEWRGHRLSVRGKPRLKSKEGTRSRKPKWLVLWRIGRTRCRDPSIFISSVLKKSEKTYVLQSIKYTLNSGWKGFFTNSFIWSWSFT